MVCRSQRKARVACSREGLAMLSHSRAVLR
jgi:hypothetical protein